LKFIIDLRPGIPIGVELRLIVDDVCCTSQTSYHVNIECVLPFWLRWNGGIDIDGPEMPGIAHTTEVVLDVTGVESIKLDQVHRHILTVPALVVEQVVAIGMPYRYGTNHRDVGWEAGTTVTL